MATKASGTRTRAGEAGGAGFLALVRKFVFKLRTVGNQWACMIMSGEQVEQGRDSRGR